MRTLIVADIHSNLEAFTSVVEDAQQRGGFDQIWCLGDLVGYGPDPGPCIDLLRQFPHTSVAGNHDRAAVGLLSLDDFNPYAAAACRWTSSQLSLEHKQFLTSLLEVEHNGDFTLVHGSLRAPLWEYLLSPVVAAATFRMLTSRFCLVGHSHIPFLCHEEGSQCSFYAFPEEETLTWPEGRWIINPGGVGQPRDNDPRPSYAIYDDEAGAITRYRVHYQIAVTQDKMRRANLPAYLIERLDHGV